MTSQKDSSLLNTFFQYVSFNILGMIGLSCYILADTFFIAQSIGADGLTSLNLAIPIYNFMNATALMIGIGAASRFSLSNSKTAFTQACYCALFFSTLFFLIGIFCSHPLALLLGADAATIADTNIYLKILMAFAPFFMINEVLLAFVRNDYNPKLAMIAMTSGSIANIIFDYLFLFIFHLGMFGAALATGFSPILSMTILSTHFVKRKNHFHLKRSVPSPTKIIDIFSLGSSAFITEMASGIVIILFNFVILKISGNLGVAAYGIIANIALVVIAIITGIAQGSQPLISDNYGKGNKKQALQVKKYGILLSLVITILIYIPSFIFSTELADCFNKEKDVMLTSMASHGIKIYFISFLFAGINIITANSLCAMANTTKGFLISLFRGFLLLIPVTLLLAHFFGMTGVWLATPVTEGIVFSLSLFLGWIF